MSKELNPKKKGFAFVLSVTLFSALLAGCQSGQAERTSIYPVFPSEIAGPAAGESDFEKGFILENGLGVPRNYSAAISAYKSAAMSGDARALNNLGVMAATGRGVSGGFERAENHFISAAKGGSSSAHYNLGLISETKGNPAAARIEYRMAAEQGHAAAQFRLATLIQEGIGGPVLRQEAQRLRGLAAVNGDPEALSSLSAVSGLMTRDAARDHFAIENCSTCASEQEKGMGVRSIAALEELAMSGDSSARYNLGVRHLQGEGVVKDPSEAARHFELAARSGHAPSQRQLAQMHMRGQAVAYSKVLAYYWLNLAARGESLDARSARRELEQLEVTMSPAQVLEAQALSTHGDAIGR